MTTTAKITPDTSLLSHEVDDAIPTRAANALWRFCQEHKDIQTVADLAALSPKEFVGIRGCGKQTLADLTHLLRLAGMKWGNRRLPHKRRNTLETEHGKLDAAHKEIARLTAERDDARRLYCSLLEAPMKGDGLEEAYRRGWLCFNNEETP